MRIVAMEEETAKLKDSAKEKENRARMTLLELKYKLKSANEENAKLANDLKSLQALTASAPATSTTLALTSVITNDRKLKSSNYLIQFKTNF